jgi:hypothetical protein
MDDDEKRIAGGVATEAGRQDALLLDEAVLPSNSWNRPIPAAAQFWQNLSRFQRALYPDVPIFINRQPSFYENQLASNDLSSKVHPATGRILWSFEPVWLGDATGRGAEPSTQRSVPSRCMSDAVSLA